MRFRLISDNIDTLAGMRLAGIEGVVVHTKDETAAALETALASPDIGILLITEKLAKLAPDTIDALRLNRRLPIIVVIPDRHGTGRPIDSITRYVNESIGIKF